MATEEGAKEFERRMVFARQEAARAWDSKKPIGTDKELCEKFAKILVVHMYEPHLGCATTRELLAEVAARCDLNYKTVPDESL